MTVHAPNLELPWYSSADDDARFRKVLAIGLGVFLLLAVAVPLVPVPELSREERASLPPQLAQVVLEKKEIPKPPPPPPAEAEPEATPEPLPEPETVEEPQPEPEPEPEPEPVDRVAEAREKAANSGLLQFRDDLAEMRDAMDLAKVENNSLTRGDQQAAEVDRSVVTSGAQATSGGIDSASLSRDTGGVALSGRETTKVESELAERSGSGNEATETPNGQRRSDEEIRQVMDRNKDAIFAIYNRALRRDPALQGKVTVKLTIAPTGQITAAEIVSSELGDESLERRLLARIQLIAFEAKSVIRTVVNYSFDFLPY